MSALEVPFPHLCIHPTSPLVPQSPVVCRRPDVASCGTPRPPPPPLSLHFAPGLLSPRFLAPAVRLARWLRCWGSAWPRNLWPLCPNQPTPSAWGCNDHQRQWTTKPAWGGTLRRLANPHNQKSVASIPIGSDGGGGGVPRPTRGLPICPFLWSPPTSAKETPIAVWSVGHRGGRSPQPLLC